MISRRHAIQKSGLLLGSAAFLQACQADRPALPASDATTSNDALDDVLRRLVVRGAPGISVAIANTQGLAWQGTAGYADLQAKTLLTTDHIFGIGSITKVFIAVIILQLAQEGRIDVYQSATAYLAPDVLAGIANTNAASIAHLMSHTSGVPSWEDDPVWIAQGRGRDLDINKIWGKTETLDYIRGPQHHAVNAPGAAYSYSNTNHTILGLVIEAITGNDAASEVRARILEPLGIPAIFLEGFESGDTNRLPRRYHHNTQTFRTGAGIAASFTIADDAFIDATGSNMSVEWTAGGMVANPADLAIFARALRDGALLNAQSMAFMQDWFDIRDSAEVAIGHGVFRRAFGDAHWIGHGGNVLGFTTNMYWLEDGDAIVIVSTNVGSMHCGDVPMTAHEVMGDTSFRKYALEIAKA